MFRRSRKSPKRILTLQSIMFFTCDVIRLLATTLIILEHSTQYFLMHHSTAIYAKLISTTPFLAHSSHGHAWLLLLSGFFFVVKVNRMDISTFRKALVYLQQRVIRLWPLVAFAYLLQYRMTPNASVTPFQHFQQLAFLQNVTPLSHMIHPPSWCISVDFQLHVLGLLFLILGQRFSIKATTKTFLALMYIAIVERFMRNSASGCSFYSPPSAKYLHRSYVTPYDEWQDVIQKLHLESNGDNFDLKEYNDTMCTFENIFIRTTGWFFPFVLGTFLGHTMIQELKLGRPSFPKLIHNWKITTVTIILLCDCLRSWHRPSLLYIWRDYQLSSLLIAILMYQLVWNPSLRMEGCLLRILRRTSSWMSRLTYVYYMFHEFIGYMWTMSSKPPSTDVENLILFLTIVGPVLMLCFIPIHYFLERPFLRLYGGGYRSFQTDILPSKQKA